MKRVLLVATTSYAGMGPYVSEIVNGFSPDDDIYYFFHDYEDRYFERNVKEELRSRSVFCLKPNSAQNKLLNLITNRFPYDRALLKLCKEKRIELVHYINDIPTARMQREYEKMGITVLSTVHDLEPHEAKKSWYKMLRQYLLYRRLAKNLQKAKYLVTNSFAQYDSLKVRYGDKTVTYHPFPTLVTQEIVNGHETPEELTGIDKPYILFFGRIEKYKGIDLLYKAFTSSPRLCENFRLVIAGSGELGFERISDERGVVFINRYIRDTEVASLYRNAHCVVYPYISATQSGVLSLAFYYQVPVVASDIPFFKGIIGPSSTGLLFEKENVEDLQRKLLTLCQTDVSAMRNNQRAYYDKHYGGNAIREQLLKIYSMSWSEADSGILDCKE